ncbi:MAG: hypothetical protein ACE5GE_16790 [Phycisphaerae bacterium]
MSSIDAVGGVTQGQVGVEVATFALKQANEQQAQVAKLLESAVQNVKGISEPGKGDHVDTHA